MHISALASRFLRRAEGCGWQRAGGTRCIKQKRLRAQPRINRFGCRAEACQGRPGFSALCGAQAGSFSLMTRRSIFMRHQGRG